MNGTKIMLSALMTLLMLPGMVAAACSLGANPLHMSVSAVPGETVVVTWNLYNIHGDRVTHVVIEGAEENPDWEVFYDPELHTASYNVTGVVQEINENVGLAATEVVDEIPNPKPEGYDYVNYPGGDGYIPVMPIDIFVKVPEDAELFEDYVLTFNGVGKCFMEEGTVIPGIATKLELTIRTVSGEPFFETPIATPADTGSESPVETGNEGGEGRPATTEGGDSITGFVVANATWIGLVVILIIIIVIMGFRNRSGVSGGYDAGKYSWTPPG